MVISRSPLRISLGGGGTDLESFYKHYGGFVLSAAIDKYVYVNVMRPFNEGIYIKYSQCERVQKIEEIKHPIIREVLKYTGTVSPQIEITTFADIPAGTGLGSSGSFTTAFIKALYTHRNQSIHQEALADLACKIEINKLGEPIGKQDQYIAAYGGITSFTFQPDGQVQTEPLAVSRETLFNLEDNLLLFFTGFSRSASSVLRDQDVKSQQKNINMINNLKYVKELGYRCRDAIASGQTNLFGSLMHEHWEHKKRRSLGMSNSKIDDWYRTAITNGAIGGKVVGAGGGGFLLLMASDRRQLRKAMVDSGLEEVRFKFDFEGTKNLMTR